MSVFFVVAVFCFLDLKWFSSCGWKQLCVRFVCVCVCVACVCVVRVCAHFKSANAAEVQLQKQVAAGETTFATQDQVVTSPRYRLLRTAEVSALSPSRTYLQSISQDFIHGPTCLRWVTGQGDTEILSADNPKLSDIPLSTAAASSVNLFRLGVEPFSVTSNCSVTPLSLIFVLNLQCSCSLCTTWQPMLENNPKTLGNKCND